MNYSETLQYLFDRLPMFTRIGVAAYKVDLTNTIRLCEAIGNPHLQFKSIHVAGTNGKGSCSHLFASVLQHANYKTGLYTSPHLVDFNERIKINGNPIQEEWVIQFVENIVPIIDEINPSFFEVTVAMAFQYFAEQKVDIAIIETGLGGLLDSTNIIKPELSVITNISLDHTNLLGTTLNEIAFQKAGIIKDNVPVVIGEFQEEIASVFIEKANQKKSSIYFAEREYKFISSESDQQFQTLLYNDTNTNETISILTDLIGQYQRKNICTVLTGVNVLVANGWKITSDAISKGISSVRKTTGLKGRFDILQQNPTVIADVAHNEAGLNEVFQQIKFQSYTKLHIVTGFVRDKDVRHALSLFPTQAIYYFTEAAIPRALPTNELAHMAREFGLDGFEIPECKVAIEKALENANQEDLVLCTGSFFILSDIYQFIESKNRT